MDTLLVHTCACCLNEPRIVRGQRSKFCSDQCRRAFYRQRNGLSSAYPGLPSASVGAIGELRVSVDLLAKGYEVFRAVSASCSCDLAILKNGRLLRIEVRTGYRIKATGALLASRNRQKDAGRQDHYAFVLPGEIIYDPPLPEA
jgi:hypothetical protein